MVRIRRCEAAEIWSPLSTASSHSIVPSDFSLNDIKFGYILDANSKVANRHHYFVTNKDQVYSTGNNIYGLLGVGIEGSDSSHQLHKIDALCGKKVIDLAGGSGHMLALTADGQVFAWGCNDRGQLGLGALDPEFDSILSSPINCEDEDRRSSVTRVSFSHHQDKFYGPNIVKVACEGITSFALDHESNLYIWGGLRALDKKRASQYKPLQIPVDGLGDPITDIQMTDFETIINSKGQIAILSNLNKDGVDIDVNLATLMPEGESIKKLVSRNRLYLALTESGNLFVWGRFIRKAESPRPLYLPYTATDIVTHGNDIEIWTDCGPIYKFKAGSDSWRPEPVELEFEGNSLRSRTDGYFNHRFDIENEESVDASNSSTDEYRQDIVTFEFAEPKDDDGSQLPAVKRLECNKKSLADASPAFLAWLTGNWKDSNFIRMDYYPYETIEAFISFVKSRELESDNLSVETMMLLYDLANQYLIKSLRGQCLVHLESKLFSLSMSDIFSAYDSAPLQEIRNLITQFLSWRIDDFNCSHIARFAFERKIHALFNEARCQMIKLRRGEKSQSGLHSISRERLPNIKYLAEARCEMTRMRLLRARMGMEERVERHDSSPAKKSRKDESLNGTWTESLPLYTGTIDKDVFTLLEMRWERAKARIAAAQNH